ncbi:uncharacterized protein F4822DRAFT_402965 [Hypoxylon trugodes]|uniref:uncharacterized protein n=1 Tax=Hypoxylon trugodes TaxID=326681 RepID=UPI00219BB542|nr:uncharacterized protein F4822DRAFT_402965 [Hypoxylon trugodes]KAI1388483.1 hypothetical protein F4822DRAFT_402965 [Hypoxylon trugodes]
MSSFVFTPKTKQVSDNDRDTIPSNLSTSINKPDKRGTFKSDSSTIVEIDLDSFSPNGLTVPITSRGPSPGPPSKHRGIRPKLGFRGWCESTWRKNKAPILMFLAQFFGASMNLAARLLEVEEGGMHPIQVLFARMTMTAIGAWLYIWWKKVPNGILGPKEIRWLLLFRGFTGFFGIYGMWYSVRYIPLADATVITFLAPNIAGYICHVLLHDPFTRKEQIASFIALGGVILITRPVSLFSGASSSSTGSGIAMEAVANSTVDEISYPGGEHVVTSAQRLSAVGFALLGVLGAAGAITTLRCIGKRAHPLISVNYFSMYSVVVTTATLTLAPILEYDQPNLRFELPHSMKQVAFLLIVGVCGLVMQMLMTAGLASEKSNRATAMIYTHMLFAAGFDRFVFGHIMGWTSLTGCGLIIGSALWVALTKKGDEKRKENDGINDVEIGAAAFAAAADSESAPMLSDDLDREEEEEEGVMLERL